MRLDRIGILSYSGFAMSLLAVHISDGVLFPSWWVGGIVLMVVLAVIGAWRIRDEEIPRIALLTSVFFVASLVQLPVPPTHAHLLLNGLMGVVLGWRAALAIPLGVFLQTVLFQQGNLTTLGINSCLMTVPAIAASYLFSWLQGSWLRRPWLCSALMVVSFLVWALSLMVSVALLLKNDWQQSVFEIALSPIAVGSALLLAGLAAWVERRMDHSAEFPLGLFLGVLTVLGSVSLNYFVLIEGGIKDWRVPARLEVLFHLPIAAIEGIILGFTLGFLGRVKPEMLGIVKQETAIVNQESEVRNEGAALGQRTLVGLILVSCLFGWPLAAQAHRLRGEYKILPDRKIRIESWFDISGASPEGAQVRVFGPGGKALIEGQLDGKGLFVFSISRAEDLRVVISAGAGHRKELVIKSDELAPLLAGSKEEPFPQKSSSAGKAASENDMPPPADRRSAVTPQDVLLGIGFVLALAAFVLGWRNARALAKLRKAEKR